MTRLLLHLSLFCNHCQYKTYLYSISRFKKLKNQKCSLGKFVKLTILFFIYVLNHKNKQENNIIYIQYFQFFFFKYKFVLKINFFTPFSMMYVQASEKSYYCYLSNCFIFPSGAHNIRISFCIQIKIF